MDLRQIGKDLDLYLHLQSFPVAVRMITSAEDIPKKARMPKRDLETPMAVCQGIALARRSGWLMAMSREDMACPLGALTLGFVPARDKFLNGSISVYPWLKNQGARAKMAQALPRLEPGKYNHILIAPVHRADFEAHLIIVYGNPAQIARLIQAAIYGTGTPMNSQSFGGFACGEEITKTILSDECQFILTGGGDRVFAQTHDREVVFAMPVSKVNAIVEGLEETEKAGLRYPTPAFLTFVGAFPPTFVKLMEYLKQGD